MQQENDDVGLDIDGILGGDEALLANFSTKRKKKEKVGLAAFVGFAFNLSHSFCSICAAAQTPKQKRPCRART